MTVEFKTIAGEAFATVKTGGKPRTLPLDQAALELDEAVRQADLQLFALEAEARELSRKIDGIVLVGAVPVAVRAELDALVARHAGVKALREGYDADYLAVISRTLDLESDRLAATVIDDLGATLAEYPLLEFDMPVDFMPLSFDDEVASMAVKMGGAA
jgi:hypothetical protein